MDISKLELQFVDEVGKTVLNTKLIGLPIKESAILSKSMECFNDPEPCMIHRSAVQKTIYLELYEYFSGVMNGRMASQQWIEIPEHLRAVVDIKPDVSIAHIRLSV